MQGISRSRLADDLHISAARLSKIVGGSQRFPADLAHTLTIRFGLPLEFFSAQDPVAEAVTPTFRKRARARALDEKQVVRLAREASRVFSTASEDSGYRTFEFPSDPDLLEDEEQCAREVRRAGGLNATEPVPNVTRLLERQGIAVVPHLMPQGLPSEDHTGITLPSRHNSRPLIALGTKVPGAVARFTLAHEAAHHIWDRDLPSPLTSTRDPREQRAHRFAGALLLPASEMVGRVDEGTSLRALLPVKADFGVSVGAIIMRAHTLRLISDARARSLQIQLSSLGWRDPLVEPVEVTDERPLLFKQALARVTDMSALSLARYTGLPPELINHWAGIPMPDIHWPDADIIDLNAARRTSRAASRRR
ncbi:XRE family transcriptional regulator [Aestuariimicrobium sp. p3-SID1156]|uniref:XRE family transcriptional regulator n=1 Tax=Aestuariimicrobium sp. p3-SID1156 TaxID=2916038 RepID=UPI00223B5626|nr:XRE family transcriptional regulator [Aestuariimicrobium sp. p3-SID1156]MCT1458485.1 XRE family transcriptional regulator [Aestuariimicrobium sp. p3-SID1156]